MHGLELGIYTFVENTPDPETFVSEPPELRIKDLLEEVVLADQLGLDVFGIGEHHRREYLASSPAVLMAAAAAQTKDIRLTSAVTVLSSDDPVRVYQDFATVDLISNGRAEIMVGRGSFIESFPLFGYDLNDYDALFAEKLELLLKIRDKESIVWDGEFRPALHGEGVYPRALQSPLPVWLAVGGTPQSAVRAGKLGLPMALAIIGGEPARFKPFTTLFREASAKAGHGRLPLSINAHGFIGDNSRRARDEFHPYYVQIMNKIGLERGWPPTSRAKFDEECGPDGALLVGSPQEVIDKILAQHPVLGFDRYLLQFSLGTLPHESVMRSIELLGTVVAPAVRKSIGSNSASAPQK
jgi:probable LLM family oxidoreductase